METIAKINLDLQRPTYATEVNAMQDDGETRILEVTLTSGGAVWNIPEGVSPVVVFRRPNYTKGMYDKLADGSPAVTTEGNTVTVVLSRQMLAIPGLVKASLQFEDAQLNQLTTFPFCVNVQANPYGGAQSVQDVVRLQWLEEELDKRAEQIEKAVYEKVDPAVEKAQVAAEEANKAAAAIPEKIAGKLDKPADQPAAGQILKVKSVNPDGSFVVEWANAGSTGGGTLSDVQIDGVSVVNDGIAEIPVSKSSWESSELYMLRKIHKAYGLVTINGTASISAAEDSNISLRDSKYRPIVPSNIDYAIRSAMCDGKGPSWEADEQLEARKRMGISEYQLLNDIILSEESAVVSVNQDKNGIQYKLKSIFATFTTGETVKNGNIQISVLSGDNRALVDINNAINQNTAVTKINANCIEDAYWVNYDSPSVGNNSVQKHSSGIVHHAVVDGITGIEFHSGDVNIPVGTRIKIYGVKK